MTVCTLCSLFCLSMARTALSPVTKVDSWCSLLRGDYVIFKFSQGLSTATSIGRWLVRLCYQSQKLIVGAVCYEATMLMFYFSSLVFYFSLSFRDFAARTAGSVKLSYVMYPTIPTMPTMPTIFLVFPTRFILYIWHR